MAIVGFRHRGLRELFENGHTAKIGQNFHAKLIKLLDLVDSAAALDDLKGVSDFHGLKGDRAGEYALHANGNWCVTFTFDQGDANHLNFEDYHRR